MGNRDKNITSKLKKVRVVSNSGLSCDILVEMA